MTFPREELFGVRHLLILRSGQVLTELKRITKDGFTIWSGNDINAKFGNLNKAADNIWSKIEAKA